MCPVVKSWPFLWGSSCISNFTQPPMASKNLSLLLWKHWFQYNPHFCLQTWHIPHDQKYLLDDWSSKRDWCGICPFLWHASLPVFLSPEALLVEKHFLSLLVTSYLQRSNPCESIRQRFHYSEPWFFSPLRNKSQYFWFILPNMGLLGYWNWFLKNLFTNNDPSTTQF